MSGLTKLRRFCLVDIIRNLIDWAEEPAYDSKAYDARGVIIFVLMLVGFVGGILLIFTTFILSIWLGIAYLMYVFGWPLSIAVLNLIRNAFGDE